MKAHTPPPHKAIAAALTLALTFTGTAQAATETWDGGHGSANAWYANLN